MALAKQSQKMLDALSELAGEEWKEDEYYFVVTPYTKLFSLKGIGRLFTGTSVPGQNWSIAVEKHGEMLVLFFSPDSVAAMEKAVVVAEQEGLEKDTLLFKATNFYKRMEEAGKSIAVGTVISFKEKTGGECCVVACFKKSQAERVVSMIYRLHREVCGYDEDYCVRASVNLM